MDFLDDPSLTDDEEPLKVMPPTALKNKFDKQAGIMARQRKDPPRRSIRRIKRRVNTLLLTMTSRKRRERFFLA